MIEKKIHYIWFGKKPLPELAKKCINSWRKYCPDYEIIEWNEDNFDINANTFAKEAYQCKKWAFVSDYARLYVLYNYGGIYMDTDVELVNKLDDFLNNEAFSGFESYDRVPTGIIAAKRNDPVIGELLSYYDNKHFIVNGSQDTKTNVNIITDYFKAIGLTLNNTEQVCNGFRMYPNDVFCPKDPVTKSLHITENTVAIHHFDGSWIPFTQKMKYSILNKLDKKTVMKIVNLKKRIKERLNKGE